MTDGGDGLVKNTTLLLLLLKVTIYDGDKRWAFLCSTKKSSTENPLSIPSYWNSSNLVSLVCIFSQERWIYCTLKGNHGSILCHFKGDIITLAIICDVHIVQNMYNNYKILSHAKGRLQVHPTSCSWFMSTVYLKYIYVISKFQHKREFIPLVLYTQHHIWINYLF